MARSSMWDGTEWVSMTGGAGEGDGGVGVYLPLTGGVMSGVIDMNDNNIDGVDTVTAKGIVGLAEAGRLLNIRGGDGGAGVSLWQDASIASISLLDSQVSIHQKVDLLGNFITGVLYVEGFDNLAFRTISPSSVISLWVRDANNDTVLSAAAGHTHFSFYTDLNVNGHVADNVGQLLVRGDPLPADEGHIEIRSTNNARFLMERFGITPIWRFAIEAAGTFVLQKSNDAGINWDTVESWT